MLNLTNLNNLGGLGLKRNKLYNPLLNFEPSALRIPSNPDFTRSTTGTLTDFEGLIKTAHINEFRLNGFRRVENLLSYSEDFSDAVWVNANIGITENVSDPDGGLTAVTIKANAIDASIQQIIALGSSGLDVRNSIWARRRSGSGDVRFQRGGAWQTIALTTIWKRIAPDISVTAASDAYFGVRVTTQDNEVDIWHPQLENVTGQSNQNPSEYVSSDVATGGELIVNGDFDTPLGSEWYSNDSDISIVDEELLIVTDGDYGRAVQELSLTVGTKYLVTFDFIRVDCTGDLGISSDPQGGGVSVENKTVTASGSYSFTFGATATTLYLRPQNNVATDGVLSKWDNISVKEISHNSNIDSVKYLKTENGNTVSSNVVTEATGSVISTSVEQGLINEPQGTCLNSYSEDIGDTYWNKGTRLTIGTPLKIKGLSLDNIIESSTNDNHYFYTGGLATGTKTCSAFLKTGTSGTRNGYVRLRNSTEGEYKVTIDLSDGSVVEELGTGTYTMEDFGDGVYRLSVTRTTTNLDQCYIGLSDGTNKLYQGDGTSNLYIGAVNVEASAYPSTYIKTVATTVTRNGDVISVDNTNRNVLPNSFAYIIDMVPLADGEDMGDYRKLMGSGDSRGQNYEMPFSLSTSYNYTPYTGGGLAQFDKADITKNTQTKLALQLKQEGGNSEMFIYKDGVQEHSESNAQTLDHSNNTIEVGQYYLYGGQQFPMIIKQVRVYKPLSESKLIRLTT